MQIPYKAFTSSPKAAEAVSDLDSGLYLGNCRSHIPECKTKEVKWVSLPETSKAARPAASPQRKSLSSGVQGRAGWARGGNQPQSG